MKIEKVKNPWACENSPHGSGLIGSPLEIYLCPRCGAHPTMAEDGYRNTGVLCMECGFGIRPTRGDGAALWKWNRAVEQYIDDLIQNLCSTCHYYGGFFEPDRCHICNSPENSKLMGVPKDIERGADPRDICKDYVKRKEGSA